MLISTEIPALVPFFFFFFLLFQMLFRVSGSTRSSSAFRDREGGLYYMAYLESGSGEAILLRNPRLSESYSCTQTCLKGRLFMTCGNERINGNTVYYNFGSDR